jgi:hypothetical protein
MTRVWLIILAVFVMNCGQAQDLDLLQSPPVDQCLDPAISSLNGEENFEILETKAIDQTLRYPRLDWNRESHIEEDSWCVEEQQRVCDFVWEMVALDLMPYKHAWWICVGPGTSGFSC